MTGWDNAGERPPGCDRRDRACRPALEQEVKELLARGANVPSRSRRDLGLRSRQT